MDRIRTGVGAFWAWLRYPLFSVVNAVAIVFTLAGGVAIVLNTTIGIQDDEEFIYALTLSLIVLILLILIFYLEFSVARRRRIAGSVAKQKEAFERLQTAWSVLRRDPPDRGSLETARIMFEEILTDYADIFQSICRDKCRMCIKLIENIDDEHYVYTLARDRVSARDNRNDDSRRQQERVDLLTNNSDFVKLWSSESSDDGLFFSNDLRREKDYASTSVHFRRDPNKPTEEWVLPYRSAIVWPIRQEAKRNISYMKEDRCIGFLAVDTARPGMLRIGDAAIGEILARGLYPVLEQFADVDRDTAQQDLPGDQK